MTSFGNIRRCVATTTIKTCFALYVIHLVVRGVFSMFFCNDDPLVHTWSFIRSLRSCWVYSFPISTLILSTFQGALWTRCLVCDIDDQRKEPPTMKTKYISVWACHAYISIICNVKLIFGCRIKEPWIVYVSLVTLLLSCLIIENRLVFICNRPQSKDTCSCYNKISVKCTYLNGMYYITGIL